jgi:hypothetical protein
MDAATNPMRWCHSGEFHTDSGRLNCLRSIRTQFPHKPQAGGHFGSVLYAPLEYAGAQPGPYFFGLHQGVVIGHSAYVIRGGPFGRSG